METMYDIPHPQIWSIWREAVVYFDDRVYKIMQYMIDKGIYCEINRNPTINYGSQLVVKVAKVKADVNDYTMSLPESILKLLNADFDGETKLSA